MAKKVGVVNPKNGPSASYVKLSKGLNPVGAKKPVKGNNNFLSNLGGTVASAFGHSAQASIADILNGFNGPSVAKAPAKAPAANNSASKAAAAARAAAKAAAAAAAEQKAYNGTKTLQDYLNDAEGQIGTDGINYSAEKQQLQNTGQQGDNQLASMYAQLQNQYAGQAPGITANYGGANTAVGTDAKSAEDTINAAYNAAQSAQTAQQSALGIGGAGGAGAVIASQGQSLAPQQAAAVAQAANSGLSTQNDLNQHGAAAQTFNTQAGQAAQLQGASERAALQQAIASKLATVDTAQAASQQSTLSNALQLAQAEQSSDPNSRVNYLSTQAKAAATSQANQLAANKLQESQFEKLLSVSPQLAKEFGGGVSGGTVNTKALKAYLKSIGLS